jgi:hypothetical protein
VWWPNRITSTTTPSFITPNIIIVHSSAKLRGLVQAWLWAGSLAQAGAWLSVVSGIGVN